MRMRKIIENIFKLFRKYKPGYEYWINREQIIVGSEWQNIRIGKKKLERKTRYWNATGKFESKILLDKNFKLIDGYSSLVIAENKKVDKIPVYFVD